MTCQPHTGSLAARPLGPDSRASEDIVLMTTKGLVGNCEYWRGPWQNRTVQWPERGPDGEVQLSHTLRLWVQASLQATTSLSL